MMLSQILPHKKYRVWFCSHYYTSIKSHGTTALHMLEQVLFWSGDLSFVCLIRPIKGQMT